MHVIMLILGVVVVMLSGCQGAPAPSEGGVERQATVGSNEQDMGHDAAPGPTPEQLSAEHAKLRALPWVGDSSAAQVKPWQGRYAQSGSWGPQQQQGQRDFLSGSYTIRANMLSGELAFITVDTTPNGLRLKLFKGSTFTPEDVTLEIPVSGAVDKLGAEAAHGKIALLAWDEARPRLTLYRQSDSARLWSVSFDIDAWEAPMVIAWHASGELVVEWRGGGGRYERAFHDVATGAERLRERLDPRVEAVLTNPVAWIMESPHDEERDPGDLSGLTRAQKWLRQPPHSMGLACGLNERESVRRRLIELDEGILLIAAMPYLDIRGVPRPPRIAAPGEPATPATPPVMSARCSSVTLYDVERITSIGSWAK